MARHIVVPATVDAYDQSAHRYLFAVSDVVVIIERLAIAQDLFSESGERGQDAIRRECERGYGIEDPVY